MREQKFEWGPIPRGIYFTMLWLTILVGLFSPNSLIYYVPLLIFLGLGLRPFLEITKLYDFFSALTEKVGEKKWEKITTKRRRDIENSEKIKKYKSMRLRNQDLPKNW